MVTIYPLTILARNSIARRELKSNFDICTLTDSHAMDTHTPPIPRKSQNEICKAGGRAASELKVVHQKKIHDGLK